MSSRLLLAGLVFAGGCEPKAETEVPAPVAAPSCPGAEALDQRWTPERRARLEAALAELPGDWPGQALAQIDARVAEHGPSWRASYTQACAANEPAAQRCLDAELWELDALVELGLGDPQQLARSWARLDRLLDASASCRSRPAPRWASASALQPELGRELAAVVIALDPEPDAASRRAARERLTSLSANHGERLASLAYAVPLANAEGILARLEGAAAVEVVIALTLSSAQQAQVGPGLAAEQALALARVSALAGESGRGALEEAEALARELDDAWPLLAALHARGRAELQLDQPEAARAPLAEAVALSTRLAGPENPHTAAVQVDLAGAQLALGKVEVAHDLLTQALDSFVNTLGPDHPQTLATVEQLAALLLAAGQPLDANYALLDLLEIHNSLYGADDWRTAKIKLELGESLLAMEEFDGARTMYVEALNPLVKELGADHRAVIRTSIHLGLAELALANLDEAERHCVRGRNLVKALAKDDPLVDEVERCVTELEAARKRSKRRKGKG